MKFIKHALIGIAFYEAIKYLLHKNDGQKPDLLVQGEQKGRADRWGVKNESLRNDRVDDDFSYKNDLAAGNYAATPLTGRDYGVEVEDPWKNSLANDELRAPDS